MQAPELRMTLAETVSEKFCDAFVAPLFYLVLGDLPHVGVQGVSTMDSMWGYRTERFNQLGWSAARADDVLAYCLREYRLCFLWGVGQFCVCPGARPWPMFGRKPRAWRAPTLAGPWRHAPGSSGVAWGGRRGTSERSKTSRSWARKVLHGL
jgi:adenosylcobinamide-phosphate synthase